MLRHISDVCDRPISHYNIGQPIHWTLVRYIDSLVWMCYMTFYWLIFSRFSDVTTWERSQHTVLCVWRRYFKLIAICRQKHDTWQGKIFFWQVWKEPYEAAGFVWQCLGRTISHVLWDVFSTMKEKRAVWNRDGWKVNINFRSQNLSVCCRLNLTTSEKAAVLSYF